MKDETDKEMIELVKPTYGLMKARAIQNMDKSPDKTRVSEIDHAYVNGRKLTLVFYLEKLPTGLREQFEYYHYQYFHMMDL